MIGTNASPASSLICRAASKPSITGISASSSTSCGRRSANNATACSPFSAVSTAWPCLLTMRASSRRSAAPSSAISTVRRDSGMAWIN
ncbi:hypothetical protein D3C84_1070790 [compost metagenome]